MHFKLLVAFVEDRHTKSVMDAAREAGATGCTVISHARGEGLNKQVSFLGMSLTAQRDVLLMLVEEHLSRRILEHIRDVGEFDSKPGTGIAVQIDVEDAVGIVRQAEELTPVVEDKL
ncbi:MAG TPA: P-II family nitrogen regulator [Woeseiaceae bacterium]|nr:P-II family nitrogen regulator [Woeseiaceae bacterium]